MQMIIEVLAQLSIHPIITGVIGGMLGGLIRFVFMLFSVIRATQNVTMKQLTLYWFIFIFLGGVAGFLFMGFSEVFDNPVGNIILAMLAGIGGNYVILRMLEQYFPNESNPTKERGIIERLQETLYGLSEQLLHSNNSIGSLTNQVERLLLEKSQLIDEIENLRHQLSECERRSLPGTGRQRN